MSQWTHVSGAIRIDHSWFKKPREMGLLYRKVIQKAFKNIPEGSEGPLQVNILPTDEAGSCNIGKGGEFVTTSYRWVVTITGDLRDYTNVLDIYEWIDNSVKNLDVRQGIVIIEHERQKIIIWRKDIG